MVADVGERGLRFLPEISAVKCCLCSSMDQLTPMPTHPPTQGPQPPFPLSSTRHSPRIQKSVVLRYISLAETDKGLRDILKLEEIFDCKPAIMRAFQAAKDAHKNSKARLGADFVTKPEFRILLEYLRYVRCARDVCGGGTGVHGKGGRYFPSPSPGRPTYAQPLSR